MSDEHRTHLEKMRSLYLRRLHVLEERTAIFGISTPPEIEIEIEDLKTKIAEIDTEIGSPAPPKKNVGNKGNASSRRQHVTLVIYRDEITSGSLRGMHVFLNETKVGIISDGETGTYQLESGKNVFYIKFGGMTSNIVIIDAQPGETLEYTCRLIVGWISNKLEVVPVT